MLLQLYYLVDVFAIRNLVEERIVWEVTEVVQLALNTDVYKVNITYLS